MSQRKITIPAAGGTQAVLGRYTYFYVRSASGPFQVSFDGNLYQDASQNDLFGPLDPSHKVFFQSSNGAAITVTYDFGNKPFATQDTNVSTQPADTYAKSGHDAAIAGGATVTLTGLNGSDKRRSVAVQNLDAGGNTVTVQDGGGNTLAVLQSGWPPWVREVGGVIKVKNTNGAGLSRVVIDEVFIAS